jgi:hypothetical protein
MHRILGLATTAACAFVLAALPALADTAAAPVVGAAASTVTSGAVPYGQLVAELGNIASACLVPFLLWFLTAAASHAPGWVQAAVASLRTKQAEQLLQTALDYGINAVKGATKDGTLTVDTGKPVLDQALRYALGSGAQKLVDWMGGENGIKAKLFSRLDLEPQASAAQLGVAAPAPPAQ